MKVLGLDLSLTSAGMALIDDKGQPIRTIAVKTDNSMSWLSRVEHIANCARQLAILADAVYIENYAFGSKFGREVLAELGGVVRATLARLGKEPTKISPTTVKMFATGKGKAPPCPPDKAKSTWAKVWVKENVLCNFGQAFNTSDETDAYVIALIGLNVEKAQRDRSILETLPKHQRVVIQKLTKEEEKDGTDHTKGSSRKQPLKRSRGNREELGGAQGS